ncbi:hypothetical protein Y032_0082g1545 [Ancylostoma ceylanicum]|uniref:Uncharacterized protein n=1 Tax=Ancylostoma ceylanicum TaxID=53326 RepID=A0A016TRI0_9BILA|nr:hypothetical protein Y032_0082g1545 [Ancylostoma ceylanicum]
MTISLWKKALINTLAGYQQRMNSVIGTQSDSCHVTDNSNFGENFGTLYRFEQRTLRCSNRIHYSELTPTSLRNDPPSCVKLERIK